MLELVVGSGCAGIDEEVLACVLGSVVVVLSAFDLHIYCIVINHKFILTCN